MAAHPGSPGRRDAAATGPVGGRHRLPAAGHRAARAAARARLPRAQRRRDGRPPGRRRLRADHRPAGRPRRDAPRLRRAGRGRGGATGPSPTRSGHHRRKEPDDGSTTGTEGAARSRPARSRPCWRSPPAAATTRRSGGERPAATSRSQLAHSYTETQPQHRCGAQVIADEVAEGRRRDDGRDLPRQPARRRRRPDRLGGLRRHRHGHPGRLGARCGLRAGQRARRGVRLRRRATTWPAYFDERRPDGPAPGLRGRDRRAHARRLVGGHAAVHRQRADPRARRPRGAADAVPELAAVPDERRGAGRRRHRGAPTRSCSWRSSRARSTARRTRSSTSTAISLQEVQDYISMSSHQANSNLVIIGEVWDELSAEQQDALQAAVDAAVEQVPGCVAEDEQKILAEWEEGGAMEVVDDVDVERVPQPGRRLPPGELQRGAARGLRGHPGAQPSDRCRAGRSRPSGDRCRAGELGTTLIHEHVFVRPPRAGPELPPPRVGRGSGRSRRRSPGSSGCGTSGSAPSSTSPSSASVATSPGWPRWPRGPGCSWSPRPATTPPTCCRRTSTPTGRACSSAARTRWSSSSCATSRRASPAPASGPAMLKVVTDRPGLTPDVRRVMARRGGRPPADRRPDHHPHPRAVAQRPRPARVPRRPRVSTRRGWSSGTAATPRTSTTCAS